MHAKVDGVRGVGVLCSGEVWVRASRMSRSCSMIVSYRSSRLADENFVAFTGNPVSNAILLSLRLVAVLVLVKLSN